MSNNTWIDDAVYLSTEPHIRQPVDDNWQARRELAAALRQLNLALITTDMKVAELRKMTSDILVSTERVQRTDQRIGRMAHRDHYSRTINVRHDFLYELSPVTGQCNSAAIPIHLWSDGPRVNARFTPTWIHEGQLGHLHGGVIAAIFDEVLGMAQHINGRGGVTAKLDTTYLAPTPLNEMLRMCAEIKNLSGRKTLVVGELWAGDIMTATCEGLFIVPRSTDS